MQHKGDAERLAKLMQDHSKELQDIEAAMNKKLQKLLNNTVLAKSRITLLDAELKAREIGKRMGEK